MSFNDYKIEYTQKLFESGDALVLPKNVDAKGKIAHKIIVDFMKEFDFSPGVSKMFYSKDEYEAHTGEKCKCHLAFFFDGDKLSKMLNDRATFKDDNGKDLRDVLQQRLNAVGLYYDLITSYIGAIYDSTSIKLKESTKLSENNCIFCNAHKDNKAHVLSHLGTTLIICHKCNDDLQKEYTEDSKLNEEAIRILGYGILDETQIIDRIKKELAKIELLVKTQNWKALNVMLGAKGSGVLPAYISALADYHKKQEDEQK